MCDKQYIARTARDIITANCEHVPWIQPSAFPLFIRQQPFVPRHLTLPDISYHQSARQMSAKHAREHCIGIGQDGHGKLHVQDLSSTRQTPATAGDECAIIFMPPALFARAPSRPKRIRGVSNACRWSRNETPKSIARHHMCIGSLAILCAPAPSAQSRRNHANGCALRDSKLASSTYTPRSSKAARARVSLIDLRRKRPQRRVGFSLSSRSWP